MARKPRSKTATRRPTRSAGGGGGRGGSKPLESAHQKRVRLFLERHPGATRREARGHKPDEHRTRAERAKREKRFTEGERASIKRFVRRQHRRGRMEGDADHDYRRMIDFFEARGRKGWRQFQGMKEAVTESEKLGRSGVHERSRMVRGKRVKFLVGDLTGRTRNIARMDAVMARYDLPDISWIYYG